MRKITLLLGCLIGLSGAVSAQDLQQSSEIDGLLSRLSQIGDNSGNISDYFTQEEQRTLHTYFNINKNAPTSATVNYTKPVGATDFNGFVSNNGTQTIQLAPKTRTNVGIEFQQATMALTTYTDRPTFEGDYPHSLVNEDFSGGPGAGQIVTCGTMVSSTGDDCFAAGELEAGFNITASSEFVIYIGSGTIGNTSTLMGANLFADYTLINFDPDGVYAVGMDLWVDGVSNGEVRVYDTGGAPIGSYILTNTPSTENFFGIISDDVAIGSIEIQAELDAGELFGNLAFGTDAIGGGGGPAVAFGINNTATSLATWDPTDPTTMTTSGISPAAGFENAGSIDPANPNTAYALDNGGAFYSIDLTTGVYTSLGTVAAPGAETWVAAEFDPSTGTLYALSGAISTSSTLCTIDIGAATATPVGSTGMLGAISLMIDDAGNAYGHDLVDDSLYSIDLGTGAATPIGLLGFDANFGQGACFGDGTFYLSAFDNSSFQSQWRELDVTSGSSTVIGLFNGGSDQVAWSSVTGGGTAGVSENALEGFVYYPNPATDVLSLKSVNSIDSVSLFNLLGQKVLDIEIGATDSNISLSGLTAGTYIMKVTVDGQTGTYKVLKN